MHTLWRHKNATGYGNRISGKDAVVIGASNHVGRPMAFELLLSWRNGDPVS